MKENKVSINGKKQPILNVSTLHFLVESLIYGFALFFKECTLGRRRGCRILNAIVMGGTMTMVLENEYHPSRNEGKNLLETRKFGNAT